MLEKLGVTPGPWKGVISEYKGEDYIGVANSNVEIPGYGESVAICGEKGGRKEDRTIADARLIAAAPEMLEVLIEVMECAYYWSEYDVPIGIHDRIKDAIHKATGRTWAEVKELINDK